MQPLSAAQLLSVWEWGATQSHPQRALALLAAACPNTSPDALVQLSIGRRDAHLLTLREWAFGSQLAGFATCPNCDERLEMAFEVSEIRASPAAPGGLGLNGAEEAEIETFGLNIADYTLRFRLPNSLDLAAVAGQTDVAASRRRLFERCLISAQRDNTEAAAAELPGDVVVAISVHMAEADPQADVQLALTCPVCTHLWQATFDIVSFFWQEIDDWAQRILRDIHTLAWAYGWREADILALSPRRRQFYLDMIGS